MFYSGFDVYIKNILSESSVNYSVRNKESLC